ncbi:MAG: metal ABC transporter substrate-binding protein [Bacteroidia bacterium]|nr:metal ABC transporter substrate-binding protein [Bacteroidia bacterium]
MNKIISKLLLFSGFLFLCIGVKAQDSKKVLATASMIADMAQNIAGDRLMIECIVPIGGDPHLYDPIPEDARKAANADLIIKNGLTFEGWLNELIDNSGTKAKQVLVTEGIDAVESLAYKNSADPHAWMNAMNGIIYVENITKALIELDPEGEQTYRINSETYIKKLQTLDQYIQDRVEEIPENNRVLITSHDAFQYYGRKYGIELEAILGTSTDAEEQTSDIMRVINVIRSRNIPAVFIESTVNPKLLQQIAEDNSVKIGGQLYADSIGDKDSPASSYYDMLKYNTDVIVEGLKQEVQNTKRNTDDKPGFWTSGRIGLALGVVMALILVFVANNIRK